MSDHTDADATWICTDCEHEHWGVAHGFCDCGCTYPGRRPARADEIEAGQS